jgi:hypothetical protein
MPSATANGSTPASGSNGAPVGPSRGRGNGGRRERGRGGGSRGRGGQGGAGRGGMQNQSRLQDPSGRSEAPAQGIMRQNGVIPSEAQSENLKPEAAGNPAEEEDSDVEVCFICAGPVVHNSVSPCNHRTCHICALRMRALYKNRACMHCRVSHQSDPIDPGRS